MSTIQRGFDSYDPTSAFVSTSCAPNLQGVAWRAKNCLYTNGGLVVFWGRYFQQEAGSQGGVWQAIEARALADVDVSWVVPISQPGQGRLLLGYAEGETDGQTFVQNLKNALIQMNQMAVPDTNRIDCFLDVEANTTLSATYWQGWSNAVNTAVYPEGSGYLPFYACAYLGSIGTGSGTTACNTIQSVQGGGPGNYSCYGVWSNQPQNPGGCAGGGCDVRSSSPTWAPNSCSSLQSAIWQYGDAPNVCEPQCGLTTDVDLDVTSPSIVGGYRGDQTDRMIVLRSGDLTPALAAQKNDNQIDVFARGADSKIYRITRPGPGQSWSSWQDVPGLPVSAASNPTACWRTNGSGQLQLEVLVRGIDKSYWRNYLVPPGSWTGWARVADASDSLQTSPFGDAPAGSARIELDTVYAAIGGTSAKQRYLSGNTWQLYDLGAPAGYSIASSPACVWWNNDQNFDVFVRGTDNNVYNKGWNSTSGWALQYSSSGMTSQVQPTTASRLAIELDVFFVPVGGTTIQVRSFDVSLGWQPIQDLGAPTAKGVVSAATGGWSRGGIQLDVVTRGSDNYLYVKTNAGGWSTWAPVAPFPGLT